MKKVAIETEYYIRSNSKYKGNIKVLDWTSYIILQYSWICTEWYACPAVSILCTI